MQHLYDYSVTLIMLQAGLFDGTVAIYNVRSTDPDSALDSRLVADPLY